MMEVEMHELTAGYALDALDSEERTAYEEHLAGCVRCQQELASFSEVTGALAVAATGPVPPAALRQRILEGAQAERRNVVPLDTPRRRITPLLGAVSAVAAVAAIGLGSYAVSLDDKLGDTRAALARQREAAAVLGDPSARTVVLAAGRGRLVVTPRGNAAIVLDDLRAAPAGKTYQLWVIEGKTPTPAGLFNGAGRTVALVAKPVFRGDVVAVTLERAGGVEAPTTAPLAASKPL